MNLISCYAWILSSDSRDDVALFSQEIKSLELAEKVQKVTSLYLIRCQYKQSEERETNTDSQRNQRDFSRRKVLVDV